MTVSKHKHECTVCTFRWWCGLPLTDGRCLAAQPVNDPSMPLCSVCGSIAVLQLSAALRRLRPRQVVALWRAVARRLAE